MPRWKSLPLAEKIGIIGITLALVAIVVGLIGWRWPRPAPQTKSIPLAGVMQSQQAWCFRDDSQHPQATLTLGGLKATHTNSRSFIQCGNTDYPSRASGVYRFGFHAFPADSELISVTARVGVDEASFDSQRGTRASWVVVYDGRRYCTARAVYGHPSTFDCHISIKNPDLARLAIRQRVTPQSTTIGAGLWVGMIDPTIQVTEP